MIENNEEGEIIPYPSSPLGKGESADYPCGIVQHDEQMGETTKTHEGEEEAPTGRAKGQAYHGARERRGFHKTWGAPLLI